MNLTSKKIIDCVIFNLKNNTLDDLSMSKIAQIAKVGKSTIYEYYKSKDEMIYAAMNELLDDYASRLSNCSLDKPFYECCFEHMNCIFDITGECKNIHNIIFHKGTQFLQKDKLVKLVDDFLKFLQKRLISVAEVGIKEGIIKPKKELDNIVYLFNAFINGIIICYTSGMIHEKRETVIKDAYENLLLIVNN